MDPVWVVIVTSAIGALTILGNQIRISLDSRCREEAGDEIKRMETDYERLRREIEEIRRKVEEGT
jgi:ribosome recycling factor